MNKYEKLLQQAKDDGVTVHESYDLNGDKAIGKSIDGLYIDGNVALDEKLDTTEKKACVLAEELGHHYTTVGDITDIRVSNNRKQERQARLWAYDSQIGLSGLIKAFEAGCQDVYEIAAFLDVTVGFLQEATECYRNKYGIGTIIGNYYIMFIPNIQILKIL